MSRQLTLDLPHRTAMGRDDFYVSAANQTALAGIEAWQSWPQGKMILVGPEGAGKTHLTHVWAALSGAEILSARDLPGRDDLFDKGVPVAVEDADRVAGVPAIEEALFHLHNGLAQGGAALLITAREPAALWGTALPDLASRMAQASQLRMEAPDDALLSAVMLKLSHDLGLAIKPDTVAYAAARIDRSFAAAARFITALDAAAIDRQRAPSKDLARQVILATQND